ncbi:MAG: type II secretion system F family protein [Candidatus Pacearchaeota archaeon]|nr:MAG: type II secretion system F family protein [Candidatus Pacearchaeota archaeon]
MVSILEEALGSIKSNISRSEKIVRELYALSASYNIARGEEKVMIEKSAMALINQLQLINEPIGALVESIVVEKAKPVKRPSAKRKKYERITTVSGPVYITKESKEKFLEDLGIEKKALRKVRKKILKKKPEITEEIIARPSALASFANKIFYNTSKKLSKKPFFKSIGKDLRKANMPYTLSSYISIILFLTLLSFIIILVIALFFTTSLSTAIRNFAIVIALTAIIFFLTLSWPSNTASSHGKKVDSELPFATSHMAAIASSKVEPSRIFSIMALTKEYKAFSTEMKKIVNQINVFGYDLTTALKNVSRQTSSRKFADLLNGMATTITTGGNLTIYLNEKAKNSLLDYKLSHERYSNIIGMYSDIYTALLIAAPLIFMLLLAIISIIGTSFIGMPASTLANVGIVAIALLNIIFLIFLHLTQPEI